MIDTMSVDELPTARPQPGAPVTNSLTDHPGRWLGGAIGAATSLTAAVVGFLLVDDGGRSSFDVVQIALLGVPIAWILGRTLFPLARSGGWRAALGAGALLAVVAPPLGAIEILTGFGLLPSGSSTAPGLATLVLLPIAAVFSYAAIVVTVPVGLMWALLVRCVPDEVFAALRVPHPLQRLGTGHLLAVAALAVVIAQTVQLAGR